MNFMSVIGSNVDGVDFLQKTFGDLTIESFIAPTRGETACSLFQRHSFCNVIILLHKTKKSCVKALLLEKYSKSNQSKFVFFSSVLNVCDSRE